MTTRGPSVIGGVIKVVRRRRARGPGFGMALPTAVWRSS